jgi:hypothetical protein
LGISSVMRLAQGLPTRPLAWAEAARQSPVIRYWAAGIQPRPCHRLPQALPLPGFPASPHAHQTGGHGFPRALVCWFQPIFPA